MKKILLPLLFGTFVFVLNTGCEKEKDPPAPHLPDFETMAIDFSKFTDQTKSAALNDTTMNNYVAASLTAGYWNIMIGITLAVPVISFAECFNHEANYLGNNIWQWQYDVNVLGATYKARMTGELKTDRVKWEMYVSREGVGAFEEFKWFEGTSSSDGTHGEWKLYHSPLVREAVLQIDWKKTGYEIGEIRYTYIRESDNGDKKQLSKNSYLEYGLTEAFYNAFYNIHYTTRDIEAEGFLDVYIEWSTTEYNGRIKAAHFFPNDPDSWYCWNRHGYDTICPE